MQTIWAISHWCHSLAQEDTLWVSLVSGAFNAPRWTLIRTSEVRQSWKTTTGKVSMSEKRKVFSWAGMTWIGRERERESSLAATCDAVIAADRQQVDGQEKKTQLGSSCCRSEWHRTALHQMSIRTAEWIKLFHRELARNVDYARGMSTQMSLR